MSRRPAAVLASWFRLSRHEMELRPLQSDQSPGQSDVTRLELRSHRGMPSQFTVFDFRTGGTGCSNASLLSVPAGGGPVQRHDLFGLVAGGRRRRLVFIPAETQALQVEVRGEGTIVAVRAHELGPVPLFALLAGTWMGRHLRRPGALPAKLGTAIRTVVLEGPSAARRGLVVSQMASQASGTGASATRSVSLGARRRRRRPRRGGDPKRRYDKQRAEQLDRFLSGGERLQLPASSSPGISIVLVLHGRAELTLACLRSVAEHAGAHVEVDVEVVIVDNASPDRTSALLERLDGATVVRNQENLGFAPACAQGVGRCTGAKILLLNNDALLLPNSVGAAARALEETGAAVVGGRIEAIDGRLQEAGSIVWADGSCQGYGRGEDPGAGEYRFRREVDFVSGAFLMTPRSFWDELGGFDECFSPAYYEDVDLCLRAWNLGRRVIYEPRAAVVHYEYASSGIDAARAGMGRNRHMLVERHRDELARRSPPAPSALLSARTYPRGRRRVLVIDDGVPAASIGSGAPRAAALIRALVDLDCEVTLYPTLPFAGDWDDVYDAVPAGCEAMLGPGRKGLRRFLAARDGHYSDVIVSRIHNMALVEEIRARHPVLSGTRRIYDVEAIDSIRDGAGARVRGRRPDEITGGPRLEAESATLRAADRVTCVSEVERRIILERGVGDVALLGHGVEVDPTPAGFDDRQGLLFVGPLTDDWSPNVDGMMWFLEQVLPRLAARLPGSALVRVAGRSGSLSLAGRRWEGVHLLGPVEDLRPLYDRARVFVAPTRFSAGVPLKVIESAAHGLPVVGTDLIARQLGWDPGVDLLAPAVSDAEAFAESCERLHNDEALWRRLRQAALERARREYGYSTFVGAVRDVLSRG